MVFWVFTLNLKKQKQKPRVNSLPKSIHPLPTQAPAYGGASLPSYCPSSPRPAIWLPAIPHSTETGLTAPVLAAPVSLCSFIWSLDHIDYTVDAKVEEAWLQT